MSEEDPISTVEPSYREYIAGQQQKEAEADRPISAYGEYLPTYRPSPLGIPPVSTYTLPSNERGVYGQSVDNQALYGPANWRQHYPDWNQVGDAAQQDLPDNGPLNQEELDFVRAHGFEFGNKIGSGSYGAVWFVECNNEDIQGMYACKVLNLKEYEFDIESGFKGAVENMLLECDLVQAFNHDNIVKTSHVFHIHDQITGFPMIRVLLFMEYCNGDLERMMQNEQDYKLDDETAKDVMRQACSGLKVLHDNNVVHFDIKPKNILYKYDQTYGNNVYKLTDFGLSQRFKPNSFMVSESRGTDQYMDPSLNEEGESDARKADIYSMGVTLIAILVGVSDMGGCQNMFNVSSTTFGASISKHWEEIADWLSQEWNLSIGATNLIHKMTQKDWSQRPTIDEVLDDPWIADQ